MKERLVAVIISTMLLSACGSMSSPAATSIAPILTATESLLDSSSTEIPPTAPLLTSTPVPSLGTIAQDFVALLCDAQWMNGGQHLKACPTASADHSGGYAQAIDPLSEGLPASTPTLLTIPAWNGYAALFLRYPSIKVHKGDRFRARLQCQVNAACSVEYALEYYDARGKYQSPFLSWQHKAGEPPVEVDADLSSLADQMVDFVLTTRPQNDVPQQDYSLWIGPHIYRPNP